MSLEQIALQVGGGGFNRIRNRLGIKETIADNYQGSSYSFGGILCWTSMARSTKIVTVNWKELEDQTSNSLGWVANATITNGSSNLTINQIVDTLGIPFAAPMGLAFVAGFMKG